MNEEVVVHHGVKGQRWGVITKEYVPKGTHSAKADQNKKGSKIQQRVQARLAKRRNAKLAKRQAKLSKKLKSNKQTTTDDTWQTLSTDQRKKMVLESKSAKMLSKNADLFNDNELQQAYSRLMLEKRVSELAASSREKSSFEKNMETINKTMKYVKDISEAANTINNAYSNLKRTSEILASLSSEQEKK